MKREIPQRHPEEPPDGKKVSRTRKRGKLLMAGAVVGICAVAAAGLWVWHEQPGFCGTVCHDTMNSYLETYESSDYLVHQHAEAGVTCLECHEADPATQLAELQVQLSGDYQLPMAKMEIDDSFCLREGCHIQQEVVAATKDFTTEQGEKVNPHEMTFAKGAKSMTSPHDPSAETLSCSTCHTSHRKSAGIDYCYTACHHTKTFESCRSCHEE